MTAVKPGAISYTAGKTPNGCPTRCALGNGACPHCFRFEGTPFAHEPATIFETPALTLPEGGPGRLGGRLGLLENIERQRRDLERSADGARLSCGAPLSSVAACTLESTPPVAAAAAKNCRRPTASSSAIELRAAGRCG